MNTLLNQQLQIFTDKQKIWLENNLDNMILNFPIHKHKHQTELLTNCYNKYIEDEKKFLETQFRLEQKVEEEKNKDILLCINQYEELLGQYVPYELAHKIFNMNKEKADIEKETQKRQQWKIKFSMFLEREIKIYSFNDDEYPVNGIWSDTITDIRDYDWLDHTNFYWRNCV